MPPACADQTLGNGVNGVTGGELGHGFTCDIELAGRRRKSLTQVPDL